MVGMAPDQSEQVMIVDRWCGHTCAPGEMFACLLLLHRLATLTQWLAPVQPPWEACKRFLLGRPFQPVLPAQWLLPRVSVLWLQRSHVSQISQARGPPVTSTVCSEGKPGICVCWLQGDGIRHDEW